MSDIQTKQQKRAQFALEKLTAGGKPVISDLATFLVGLPNMILSNGIGQTMAFLLAKDDGKDKAKMGIAFDYLKEWLQEDKKNYFKPDQNRCTYIEKEFPPKDEKEKKKREEEKKANIKFNNNLDFLKKFNDLTSAQYIEVQDECLKLVEWLKRYARAFEKKEKEEN